MSLLCKCLQRNFNTKGTYWKEPQGTAAGVEDVKLNFQWWKADLKI